MKRKLLIALFFALLISNKISESALGQRVTFWAQNKPHSGGASPPTIRGTGLAYFYTSTINIPWPTGTIAGDFAVIEIGGVHNLASTPTGWTLNDSPCGKVGTGCGAVISKVLNSTDISTGNVTITLKSIYVDIYGITTFVGATGGIREVESANGAGASLTSTGAVAINDAGIYFGMAYAVSNNPSTFSINVGTPNPAAVTDSFYMSGAQNQDPRTTAGSYSVVYTPSAALIGGYNALIIVEP